MTFASRPTWQWGGTALHTSACCSILWGSVMVGEIDTLDHNPLACFKLHVKTETAVSSHFHSLWKLNNFDICYHHPQFHLIIISSILYIFKVWFCAILEFFFFSSINIKIFSFYCFSCTLWLDYFFFNNLYFTYPSQFPPPFCPPTSPLRPLLRGWVSKVLDYFFLCIDSVMFLSDLFMRGYDFSHTYFGFSIGRKKP